MKIFITGASGVVGSAVCRAAIDRGHSVTALYHTHAPRIPGTSAELAVDAADHDTLARLLLDAFPDAIINAAGPSAGESGAPSNPESVAVELPRHLAQIAYHLSARFLHLSAATVFDGSEAPYRSTDMPFPRDTDNQLRLMAEREVLQYGGDSAVVLRLPLLLGNSLHGNRSFHERLLQAAAKGEPLRFHDNIQHQPCSTESVAEVLVELCERPNLHGLFHWAGEDSVSEADIARKVLEQFGLDTVEIEPVQAEEALDYSLHLPPLLGKLRSQPPALDSQLSQLHIPGELAQWHAERTGEQAPVRMLRKGIDF